MSIPLTGACFNGSGIDAQRDRHAQRDEGAHALDSANPLFAALTRQLAPPRDVVGTQLPHLIAILAALTRASLAAISFLTWESSSAGVVIVYSPPKSTSFSRMSGVRSAFTGLAVSRGGDLARRPCRHNNPIQKL